MAVAATAAEQTPKQSPQLREILSMSAWPDFERFHQQNPGALHALHKMALDYKARGFERGSVKMMMEVLRWNRDMQFGPGDEAGFKLNNSHAPVISRLLEFLDPSLKGFFVQRAVSSKREVGLDA